MQILADRTLVVQTKHPARVLETVPNSKVAYDYGDGRYEVSLDWDLPSTQTLSKFMKNVPSPIKRDYHWPRPLGFEPFDHQKETASFLSLRKRAFCFNEQGTGKTASVIWAADYLMKLGLVRRVLIICPLSIMKSAWQNDLFRFAVHRSCDIAYGKREQRKAVMNSDAEFVIINFDGLDIVKEEVMNGDIMQIIRQSTDDFALLDCLRYQVRASRTYDDDFVVYYLHLSFIL